MKKISIKKIVFFLLMLKVVLTCLLFIKMNRYMPEVKTVEVLLEKARPKTL